MSGANDLLCYGIFDVFGLSKDVNIKRYGKTANFPVYCQLL